MKTVDQIMVLAGTYAYLSETQDANGRAFDEAEVALRTAIEELHRDAARYRFAKESAKYGVCVWEDDGYGCGDWYTIDEKQLDAAIKGAT